MNRFSSFVLGALSLGTLTAAVACGDDGGSGGSGETTSTTGTASPTTATSPTTTASTGSNQGGGGGTNQGGGGGTPSCDNLPMEEIEPVLATSLFNGTEDLTFDGKGNIVGKDGNEIIAVDADDNVTPIGNLPSQTFGFRYGITGDIFAARPGLGTVVRITPDGMVNDFAMGLAQPNGVYPDLDGNVWVTASGSGDVIKFDDAGMETPITMGIAVNGIVLDPTRDLLFFTDYSQGKIMRVDPEGATMPVEVADIQGANLDGLVMDECGNIYAVDNGQNRLFRVALDAAGDMVGMPVLLASFPANVANAQFGSGPGWDPNTLYVAGNPGEVYSVPVGVAGAPVATPP
ncbi:MAG: gluconolactonase [Polyangiaceae bacterium]|nr:gluconolactonase [Polyangiaceae bacterium]